ncbi:periplasmic heavy metal sensor [Chlorobium limicola]|uniref:Periplasmic heavy metal sensor n=1 Tax=Chlorobium limicola TaxID=1092 RepID=A0A101JQR1_CHLLI|nr:periplasmic heavy metal sensor [Chlorobium limicola]KUL31370.1 hypothetical protein ASB62_03045 [Chlorobium limicola]
MDFFSSKRFITATLAILVVLNVALLSLLWWQNIHKPEERQIRITREFKRQIYFTGPLALSEEQSLRFSNLRQNHFRTVKPHIQAIARLKKELVTESVKEIPDTAKIDSLAGSIGKRQAVVEKELAMHFHELAMVCTPPQRASLQKILERITTRKAGFRNERFDPQRHEVRELNIIREER